MNLITKLKGFFSKPEPVAPSPEPPPLPTIIIRQPEPVARFESAFQYYGERSLVPATLQDARFDYTPGIRKELQRRSRYWEKNSGLMQRLVMLYEQYVAGAHGIRILPATSSKDWNDRAKVRWETWCQSPEIDGAVVNGESMDTFADVQTQVAHLQFIDGEAFILLTHDPVTGEPKIQLIEAHRIETPTSMAAQEGINVIDGIAINPRTRKRIGYYVRVSDTSSMIGLGNTLYPYISELKQDYQFVPASEMIHVFKRWRPGCERGVPAMFAVGNNLHDLTDLQDLEMKAAKSAGDLANIWHTKTGQPVDSSSFRRVPRTIQTQDSAGNAVTQQSPLWYDVTQGGRDKFLKPGEDVKQFATDRPTVAQREFWDYQTFLACAGMGISRLLVAPYAPVQGTVVRSDLDTNNTFFRQRCRKLIVASKLVYRHSMGYYRDYDRNLIGAPQDWAKCSGRPPRSITADVGRQSESVINEYQAGLRTLADIYAELGEDWDEALEQRGKEAARAKEIAEKYGVDVALILAPPKSNQPQIPIKLPRPGNGAPPGAMATMYPSLLPTDENGNGHTNGHGVPIEPGGPTSMELRI